MEFENIDDILAFAIEKEQEAKAFYESLAEEEPMSGTRQMFLDFAAEEGKHERLLQDIQAGTVVTAATAAPEYKFKWVPDIQRGDFVEEPEYRPGMPYNEVLLLAIKREEKALQLYRELYRQATTDGARKIFKILRQEEARHKLGLEVMYDDFMYEMGD